jgi:shikimate kinase / 3-dehydroquinate synthase
MSNMTIIILAGFMATGKTTVGRAVAASLGWDFVDTDDLIEQAAGRSISQIFDQEAEAGFRARERQAVALAAGRDHTVIALGGGTLLDPVNRQTVEAHGLLICLDADEGAILRRLASRRASRTRPLLAGVDAAARVHALLAARAPHYASLPLHVDTTGRTVKEIAAEVIDLWRRAAAGEEMPAAVPEEARVAVSVPGSEYQVRIGHGLLQQAGAWLAGLGLTGQAVIVTQPILGLLYGGRLRESLSAAGVPSAVVPMPDGEASKNLATVSTLYAEFFRLGLERSSTVVALGGGVVGDVAGFAAGTYLRGLPVVQVPTTLLAMVDSSVGGKTGVDLPGGKNLVGVFHQPRGVLCDPDVLATLPGSELRSGLAEVVKAAVIADADLFSLLEGAVRQAAPMPLAEIVRRSVAIKAMVVAADPREQGLRATLNLGHTIGHAVEQASGYRYRHGEAVSIGLVGAARLAASLGLCEEGLPGRVAQLLDGIGLPTSYIGVDPAIVEAGLAADKKRRAGKVCWILPIAIGEVVIRDDVPPDVVSAAIRGLANNPAEA